MMMHMKPISLRHSYFITGDHRRRKCSTTTNLDGNTSEWSQLPDNQFSLPKRVRNGHIIEIDREELNRLRDVSMRPCP